MQNTKKRFKLVKLRANIIDSMKRSDSLKTSINVLLMGMHNPLGLERYLVTTVMR